MSSDVQPVFLFLGLHQVPALGSWPCYSCSALLAASFSLYVPHLRGECTTPTCEFFASGFKFMVFLVVLLGSMFLLRVLVAFWG